MASLVSSSSTVITNGVSFISKLLSNGRKIGGNLNQVFNIYRSQSRSSHHAALIGGSNGRFAHKVGGGSVVNLDHPNSRSRSRSRYY